MARFKTILKARYLRKEDTDTEKMLWKELRNNRLGVKFRRQHPVDKYILDFYAPSVKLAVELDGHVHKIKENKEYEKDRAEYLESKHITVLRFWNSELERNLENVLKEIKEKIVCLTPSPSPK